MVIALIYLGVPLLLLAVMAALPTGRPALAGLAIGAALAFGSVAVIGDDGTGFGRLLSGILAATVALAALVQLARHWRVRAATWPMTGVLASLTAMAGLAVHQLRGL